MFVTSLIFAACSGGGGGNSGASSTPSSPPIAAVSFYSPANGETGVAIGTPIVIKLTVANATSSDPANVTWICGGKTVAFASASSLSSDAMTMTITMTPALNSSSAGDVCDYNGTITTMGPGGSIKTSVGGTYTNAKAATGAALPSTAAISSYMSSAYSSDQITLATDVQTLETTLASQGLLCSSNEIAALAILKERHIQTFLNNVIANIQVEKSTNIIDKSAISSLLYTYQSLDLAWISSPTPGGCVFSAADISATGYATATFSYYLNGINALQ